MSASTYLRQARETLFPPADNPHGVLPGLLVLWTFVTGLVDAYSYLELSRVFVANMTGNVVFLGFAVAGAPGFIWWASLLAILSFMGGAHLGGRLLGEVDGSLRSRTSLLSRAAWIQVALLAVAVVVALVLPPAAHLAGLVALVLVLSIAMGLQNAVARALAVPDLTTTVLTLTITGLAGDGQNRARSGGAAKPNNVGRRLVSIFSMMLGAFVGAVLVKFNLAFAALAVAGALITVIALRSARVVLE